MAYDDYEIGERIVSFQDRLARQAVCIVYTNWRNETRERIILPRETVFESTEWHPEQQWILRAYDLGKRAHRSFAMKGISQWRPVDDAQWGRVKDNT